MHLFIQFLILCLFPFVTFGAQVKESVPLGQEILLPQLKVTFRPIEGWQTSIRFSNIPEITLKKTISNDSILIIIRLYDIPPLENIDITEDMVRNGILVKAVSRAIKELKLLYQKDILIKNEKFIKIRDRMVYLGEYASIPNKLSLLTPFYGQCAIFPVNTQYQLFITGSAEKWVYDKEFDAVLRSIRPLN